MDLNKQPETIAEALALASQWNFKHCARIAELEAALAEEKERCIQEREAWIAQKAECVTLQEKLAEALEDGKRLEAVESGRLGIQYRDGVIRDEWKWSVTYASTPIASSTTLRAAIDAARGKP